MNSHRLPGAALALLVAGATVAPATLVPATPSRAAAPTSAARGLAAPGDELRWTVQPSGAKGPTDRAQYGYDLAPGQHLDDHVAVTNLSQRPLSFTVYATDAATTADGAFTLLPASQPAADTGRWIALRRSRHTVKAGQRVVLPFRLTVPANAAAGDHAAGIIASVTDVAKDAQGQQVTVDRRVAARVYLRVTGALRPAVRIESLQTAYDNPVLPFARTPMTVTFRVRNTGNVRASGTATVRTDGPLGVALAGAHRVAVPELLPGAEVILTGTVERVFPAGMLTASVQLDAATSEGTLPGETRTATVWHVPWTLAVLLLFPLGILLYRHRRTRRPPAPVAAPAMVTAGAGGTVPHSSPVS